MGAVWLAQHLTLRSPVAVKLIDPEVAQNPEALSRFLREAQAAAALRSPHVVQILDHGVDGGVPFIVMELLDGESLASRLERVGRLSPEETARVLTQVARAMTKAHEAGVVHRDLKPDNIFLVVNDEEEIAKVLDFGIAKSQSHGIASVSSATRTGSVLGTPYYMSPEQAEGAKSVDHRTDIWAMGVIACECLVGARPFDAETLGALLLAICAREMPVPSRLGPVPPGFDAWFARACARDVSQRYPSAKQAAQELRSVCTGEQSLGPTAPALSGRGAVQAASLPLASTTADLSLSTSGEPRKKSTAPWIFVGLFALCAVGLGAFVALRSPSSSGATSEAGARTSRAAAPTFSAAPSKAAPPVVSAEQPASPPLAPPSASASKVVASATVRVAVKPRAAAAGAVAKPKPTAAPSPAPAAAPAPPTARPRVNLGI
jgi:eukaryotic-like serine/threonine-protein kinase